MPLHEGMQCFAEAHEDNFEVTLKVPRAMGARADVLQELPGGAGGIGLNSAAVLSWILKRLVEGESFDLDISALEVRTR